MRGLIGKSLTPPVATRYGAAIGSWASQQVAQGPARIVLGRDSRPSGMMIENAVAAGLASVGCRVIRVGILSTPGIAVMIDHLQAHGGVAVTASHNPLPWNGIKALRHDGVAPPPDQAQQIIRRFHEDDFAYAEVEGLHAESEDLSGAGVHVQRVLGCVDVQLIRDTKLKCVVDSVHGAGGGEAKLLLEELGVELHHIYAEPTGLFPHTPEPTAANLAELCQVTAQASADVGFAQDPDADRLAIVDEAGRYIGEEYTLALCAEHLLGQGQAVAANLSTSRMIDDIAKAKGGTVIRTPVGEANVAAAMRAHDAQVGGEGNGGIILRSISQVRDSIVGIALILEMIAKRKAPLSTIVQQIPAYAIVKDKVSIQGLAVADLLGQLADAFAEQTVDRQDGVRIDWPDRWVHVRASNTEPIMRLIVEAPSQDAAEKLIADVRQAVGLS